MSRHWSATKCFRPNPCLGREDFPRGGKYLTMCPAYIANLLPTKRYYLVGSIYKLGAATEYYINLSLILNSLLFIPLSSTRSIFYPLGHRTFQISVFHNYIYLVISNT